MKPKSLKRDFKRSDRVAEMIQRNLAELIQRREKLPDLPALLTISSVKLSDDLYHAKVYFTVYNQDPEEVAATLNASNGAFRSLLSKEMKLRVVPHLHFVYDESVEYANRLSRLIEQLDVGEDEADSSESSNKEAQDDDEQNDETKDF